MGRNLNTKGPGNSLKAVNGSIGGLILFSISQGFVLSYNVQLLNVCLFCFSSVIFATDGKVNSEPVTASWFEKLSRHPFCIQYHPSF